jgi:short-subunit dehydrogenase
MNSPNIALITGASSGIGAAFARRLADSGYNLILVARREARLTALAAEVERNFGVQAENLVADLADPAGVKIVEERVARLDSLALLVNNAGFGTRRRFADIDPARTLEMIHVHIIASVRLSRAALPGMIARKKGAIINVSSLAGFVPLPGNVTYSATKAYLTSFSQALQIELAGSGVHVQALCPGFTYTEFHGPLGPTGYNRGYIPKQLWMTAEAVVDGSLKALEREQVVYIPGLINRLLAVLIYLSPVWLQQRVLKQVSRKLPPTQEQYQKSG